MSDTLRRPCPPEPPSPSHMPTEEAAMESTVLFGARVELAIRHNGRIYRLRRTRLDKLILTA